MKKNTFLVVIILLLIVLNSVLIVMLMRSAHHPKRHGGPRNEIIEKLGFNPDQIKLYDELIKEHRKQIGEHHQEMRALKNQLYEGLKDENEQSGQDSILAKIAQKQIQIEQTHLNHFLSIQKICSPAQIADFNELLSEIAQLFAPPPPPQKEGI
ncbi:MAG: periplasmic heavy metal sensor [Bacteroidetes bacterium]|nr:periplasmic heavy metal sensor [Bacteroidota bacterium]